MSDYADESSRISDLIRQYRDVPLEDFGDVVEEEKQQQQEKRATDLNEYMEKWKNTKDLGGEELGGVVAFEGAIKMKNKVKSIYDKYKEARKKVNEMRKRLGRRNSEEEDEEDPEGFGGAEEEEDETPEGFGGAEEDEDMENEEEETAPENPEVQLPEPVSEATEGPISEAIEEPIADQPPAELDTVSEDFSSRASQLRAKLNDLQSKLEEGVSKTPLEEDPIPVSEATETQRLQLTPRDPEASEVSGSEQFDDALPRIRSFDPSLESIAENPEVASVNTMRRTLGDTDFGGGEGQTTITRLAPQQFEPAPTRISTQPIAESELPEPSLPDVIARPIQEGGTELRSALTGTGEAEGYAPSLVEGIGSRASSLIRGIGGNLLDTIKSRGQAVSQAVSDAKNFISRPASEVVQDVAGRVGGETAGRLAGGLAEGVGADTGEAVSAGIGEAVVGSVPVIGEIALIGMGLVKLGEGIYHLFHPKKEKAKIVNAPTNIAVPTASSQLTSKFAQSLPSIDTANDVSASVMSF